MVFIAYELTILIVGLILGFLIAWYLISRQKWKDKAYVLNAKWSKRITEIEKDLGIKLEKTKTEWKVKYIKDIEELKTLFKESEKKIKEKSVSASRRSLVGKFIERFVPFLSRIDYAPSDMHFIGQPIDYIVFDGLRDDKIKRIVFLEVKTGESKLTKREKSLKEAIGRKKVYWKEVRVDTSDEKTPDKEITREESSIEDLYKHIDDKIKTVDKTAVATFKLDKDVEDIKEYEVSCPNCMEVFDLRIQDKDLDKGIKVKCPHCKKNVEITNEDVAEIV